MRVHVPFGLIPPMLLTKKSQKQPIKWCSPYINTKEGTTTTTNKPVKTMESSVGSWPGCAIERGARPAK